MTLDFGASASGSYQYRKAGTDSEWQDLTVNSSGLAIINTSALELHYGSSLELKPTDGSETVTVKVLDNALRNGGFETTTVTGNGSYKLIADRDIYAWRTTAFKGTMEVYKHSAYGVDKIEGDYCAELNAEEDASLYQELATPSAGVDFTWSLKHSGRNTNETMALVIGPAVDNYKKTSSAEDDIFQKIVAAAGLDANSGFGPHTVNYMGSEYQVWIIQDGKANWGTYSDTYVIPEDQPETVFGFTSLYDVPGSGNLLDGIAFSRTPVEASGAVDENGNGSVIVDEIKNDASYTLKNADGTPITGLVAYDGNGKEITPVDGKYSTTNGPITFEVPAGKQYIVEETFGYGTVETTEAVVPAIGGNAWGELDEANNEASVTIEKADPNLQYAIIDPETGDIKGGWSDGDETSVTFGGLEPGKEYTVVSWPKDQSGAPESSDKLKELG